MFWEVGLTLTLLIFHSTEAFERWWSWKKEMNTDRGSAVDLHRFACNRQSAGYSLHWELYLLWFCLRQLDIPKVQTNGRRKQIHSSSRGKTCCGKVSTRWARSGVKPISNTRLSLSVCCNHSVSTSPCLILLSVLLKLQHKSTWIRTSIRSYL